MPAAGGSGAGAAGFCWVDVLLATALAATMAAMAVPLTARTIDAARARDAAAFIAGRIRLARQDAAATGHAVAIVFDEGPRGWSLRVCRDGVAAGELRADVDYRRVIDLLVGSYFARHAIDGRVEPGWASAVVALVLPSVVVDPGSITLRSA